MISAGLLLLAAVVLFEKQLRPTVDAVAAHEVSLSAARLIEQSVCEVLEEQNISYSQLVELVCSTDGHIEAVRADTVAINRLKSQITERIAENLQSREKALVTVPIGSLSGFGALSARGPEIDVIYLPRGSINTVITDKFKSAGINQTKHQLSLEVEVSVAAVLAGYSVGTAVRTNCLLAETVLIGEIPQTYLSGTEVIK